MKWLKNLLYRAPEGFEKVTKNAINRVKESQKTPESDPLIESCGKTIVDIIVDSGWSSQGTTTKVYLDDGTVLIIDSAIGTKWDKPAVRTSVTVNKYTIEKGRYTKQEYKEASL